MIKVFLDASVIIPALLSPTGGSFKLVQFIKLKAIIGITSRTVIEEVEDNSVKIRKSAKEIRQFMHDNSILIRKRISLAEAKPYKSTVVEKDVHVIAGAKLTKCDFLVTLDKKHLLKPDIRKLVKPLKVITPQELLEELVK
ncbi:MAG: putative toxin-antitoxin system toxin component, PIN family [Candidatus Daviesbacteria bacterium]|nr:putative toxin-antitoxin system toxin component, PIN family [Candidatus Daviesbacteria bacterium]